uniref:Uncharacterized protein n=1 Tax=Arundo donax TaxID=35708 RepID=A0A0A8XRQ3_ARUDO
MSRIRRTPAYNEPTPKKPMSICAPAAPARVPAKRADGSQARRGGSRGHGGKPATVPISGSHGREVPVW